MKTTVGATRLGFRKTTTSDPFLSIFSTPQPENTTTAAGDDELDEDDVFWTGDFAESSHPSDAAAAATTGSTHLNHRFSAASKPFIRGKKSGILAALPETDRLNDLSVFNHKAGVKISAGSPRVSSFSSSSSTSSSRMMMIPLAPKKKNIVISAAPVHQSAPVNVPVLSEAMRRRKEIREFDDIDGSVEDDETLMMMPPHEIVAAKESPILANSVLEGVGRTLKGRDLRQVRNAIWRKTGFLD